MPARVIDASAIGIALIWLFSYAKAPDMAIMGVVGVTILANAALMHRKQR